MVGFAVKESTKPLGLFVPNVIFGLSLFACTLFPDNVCSTYVSFVILILYFLWLLCAAPATLIKYFVFAFAIATNVLGCFVIETLDVSLREIATESSFAGSLPLLAFSRWAFLAVLILFDSLFIARRIDREGGALDGLAGGSVARPSVKWLEILNVAVFLLVVFLFVRIVPYPSFLSGLDRFMYVDEINTGIWRQLSSNMAYLIVIPALAARLNKSKLGYIAMGVYLLFLFWSGHKFGGYFDFLYVLMLVHFDKLSCLSPKKLASCMVVFVAITGLVVCFAAFANSFVSSKDSAQFLYDRAAQQGQLWWRTYDKLDGAFYPDQVENEIVSIFSSEPEYKNNIGEDYGIYKIMYFASEDPSVIDDKLASGSRYSEAAYALVLYYFGPIGPFLLSLVGGIMVGAVINLLLGAIRRGSLVDSVILLRFVTLVRGVLGALSLANFFTPITLLTFAYLCFSALWHANSRKAMSLRRRANRRRCESASAGYTVS